MCLNFIRLFLFERIRFRNDQVPIPSRIISKFEILLANSLLTKNWNGCRRSWRMGLGPLERAGSVDPCSRFCLSWNCFWAFQEDGTKLDFTTFINKNCTRNANKFALKKFALKTYGHCSSICLDMIRCLLYVSILCLRGDSRVSNFPYLPSIFFFTWRTFCCWWRRGTSITYRSRIRACDCT